MARPMCRAARPAGAWSAGAESRELMTESADSPIDLEAAVGLHA
jgi:hypothetical protein